MLEAPGSADRPGRWPGPHPPEAAAGSVVETLGEAGRGKTPSARRLDSRQYRISDRQHVATLLTGS